MEAEEEEQSQGAYPELEEPDAAMGSEEEEQELSGDAEKRLQVRSERDALHTLAHRHEAPSLLLGPVSALAGRMECPLLGRCQAMYIDSLINDPHKEGIILMHWDMFNEYAMYLKSDKAFGVLLPLSKETAFLKARKSGGFSLRRSHGSACR